MLDFILQLFDTDFMPHGHCYFWQPEVLWLNVGSDTLIAASYFTIPLGIAAFLRRRPDIQFRGVFVLFSAFILSCGVTHVFDVFTVWNPMYRFEGVLKLTTGLVSGMTALQVWRLMPQALAVPSPQQLADANESLREEVERRREAEQELQDMNHRLEERVAERTRELELKNRDLQQFAHVASHDLQEPLRMVSSFVGLLERRYGGELDERAHRYIAFAVEGATRMQAMVDDLLVFSRHGKDLEVEPVEVSEALDEARELLQQVFDERGVELTVQEPLPCVLASRARLRTLLQNLLSNAVKYSEGTPRIEIAARREGDTWTISVADEGIGIEPRFHDEIFAMYRRLHRDEAIPGTGIGLALVRRIVESWNGKIHVESTVGEGSTFFFTARAADADGEDDQNVSPPPMSSE